MKKAIVKGEAVRCLRNLRWKTEWLKVMDAIFRGLIEMGYKPSDISHRFREVRLDQRELYLYRKKQEKDKTEGVIVLTHLHNLGIM